MIRIRILRLAVGLAALLVGTPASGNSFDFSYVFTSGTWITGSFNGDVSGQLVTSLSDITLSVLVGGIPTPVSMYGARWDGDGWVTGPVASFDLAGNNFLFSDVDVAGGDFAYTHLYFSVGNSLGSYLELPYALDADSPSTGKWTLTDVTNAGTVPDGAPTASLLLGSFALLGLLRRRVSAVRRLSPSYPPSNVCFRSVSPDRRLGRDNPVSNRSDRDAPLQSGCDLQGCSADAGAATGRYRPLHRIRR